MDNPINILVTGSNGQLGSELKGLVTDSRVLYKNYNVYFCDSQQLDITKYENVDSFLNVNNIDVIVNCAGYTNVDKAEEEKAIANNINHLAVKNLAKISKDNHIKLIHISTDYVFDGEHYKPYIESDTTNPTSIYGQSKLDGENAIQDICPKNSIIIRSSWIYSKYGKNFVKTMLNLGRQKEELNVVFDQIGTPTYARDLAKTILDIIPQIKNDRVEIYNYSNEGVLSWYDFTKEIMKMAKIDCKVNPIETKDYLALNAHAKRPTLAIRPHYSLLNKSKIKSEFKIEIPFWKDSLDKCLISLGERK